MLKLPRPTIVNPSGHASTQTPSIRAAPLPHRMQLSPSHYKKRKRKKREEKQNKKKVSNVMITVIDKKN
jgi:hypothetical protein